MTKLFDQLQAWAPLVAAVASLAVAGWIWLPQERDLAPATTSTLSIAGNGSQENLEAALQDGAQQLLQRPLFHVTRRPPRQAEQVTAAPVNVTISLTGILDDNDIQIAILRLSNNPELQRKRIGETIGEWTIIDITKTTVTIRDQNGQEQLIGLTSARPWTPSSKVAEVA